MARTSRDRPTQRGRGRPRGVPLDGHLLRQRRLELRITQEQLSELAAVTTRTLQNAEAGKRISIEATRRLGDALGLPVITLVRPEPDAVRRHLVQAGYAPLAPPTPFAGRRAELVRVVDLLGSAEAGAQCCLSGASGMGKSALAARVAESLADVFPDGVVWIAAPREASGDLVGVIQRDVAAALGFGARLPDPTAVPHRAVDQAFRAQLFSRKRLLVVDDARSLDLLDRFLGAEPSWAVVTTAHRSVAERFEHRIEVGPLSVDAGLDLLSAHLGAERVPSNDADALRLVRLLGGVPRSLQIAGRVLRSERYTTLGEYADALAAPIDERNGTAASWLSSDDPDASFAGAHRQILGRLSEKHWQALGALAVFGDRAFDRSWAGAATGYSASEVRRLLADLADLYLLHEVPAAEDAVVPSRASSMPRFSLDAQAERVARLVAGANLEAAEDRLIDFALTESRRLGTLAPDQALSTILGNVALWRICLDSATAEVLQTPVNCPPESLDDLPPVVVDDPARALVLPQTLVGLGAWFFVKPPREGLAWLAAGVAVAYRLERDELVAPLAAALSLWLVLTVPRLDLASRWAIVAADAFERVGQVDRAVQALASAAASTHAVDGTQAALELSRRALDRARGTAVSAARLAGLLNNVGVLTTLASNEPDSLREADDLLGEARRLPDVTPDSDALGVATVWSLATINQAFIRRLLGQPVDPNDIETAVKRMADDVGADALEVYRYEVIARILTPAHPPVDEAVDAQRRRDILVSTPSDLLERRLIKLAEASMYRGLGVLGRSDSEVLTLSSAAGGRGTVRIGVTEALMGLPLGAHFGQPVAVLYPVDPLCRLLDAPCHSLVLGLVEHGWGRNHPFYAALAALGQAREKSDDSSAASVPLS